MKDLEELEELEDLEELEELKELPLNVCGVIVYTIPEGGPVLLYMYNNILEG